MVRGLRRGLKACSSRGWMAPRPRHGTKHDLMSPHLRQSCSKAVRRFSEKEEPKAGGMWLVSAKFVGKQLTRGGQTMASQRAQDGSKEGSRFDGLNLAQAPHQSSREGGALLPVRWWWC